MGPVTTTAIGVKKAGFYTIKVKKDRFIVKSSLKEIAKSLAKSEICEAA